MEGELQRIRSEFVKRVSNPVIEGLLDDLLHHEVLSNEDKDSVMENQTSTKRARCLIDMVKGKGERASQIMIDSMKARDNHLCSTLGLISSPARVDRNNETRSAGQALSEKQLMQVAETLGQEWEQAAIYLDLSGKDLDNIKADHRTVAMQKQKMLELWKRRRPQGEATAQDLLRGLEALEDLPVETRQLLNGNVLHPHSERLLAVPPTEGTPRPIMLDTSS